MVVHCRLRPGKVALLCRRSWWLEKSDCEVGRKRGCGQAIDLPGLAREIWCLAVTRSEWCQILAAAKEFRPPRA